MNRSANPSAPQTKDEGEALLDPDETVLWQDRPLLGAGLTGGGILELIFGVRVMWHALFYPAFTRRRTWHRLTHKRAFIATDLPFQGKATKSYPVMASMHVDYRPGPPGSVLFDKETRTGKTGTWQVDIGFERIRDAADVLAKMRLIQKKGAA